MRDSMFSLPGVESGEKPMVSILLTQSVFLGIFFGAFNISAHSLFLSIFDEKMMAKGYIVSAIAGIILTSLYTWLQTRMQFRTFAVINLIVVTSLTLLLWIALVLSPSGWVIFIVFIMLGPLNIMAMLGFQGTTGRLFKLRQEKRLSGLADTGLIIGIILICYTIPIQVSFRFGPINILLVGASSVLVATILQMMIGARLSLITESSKKQADNHMQKKSFLTVFRADPYTRIMAIFIALSVATAFFVQYSFMAVTREQYPSAEEMARFLGIFTGSMMIFTLLVRLLIFSYLIQNYGLRICLAISPIIVAAVTVIAIAIGMSMGYTPGSTSGFLIFFILLALSSLFSKSLGNSIESPSFKVIYQTVDEKIRYDVQSGINVTVNQIAALLSGLLLSGLGVLSFIKLIHFSWVLFIISLMWIFVAFRLYSEYRKSIRKALEKVIHTGPEAVNLNEQVIFNSRFGARWEFRTDYFSLISGDYSKVENNRNKWYFEKLIDHSGSKQDINLIPVLKKIAINPGVDKGIRQHSSETIKILEELQSSDKYEDAKIGKAKKILSGTRQPQTIEILRLLRDSSIESKRLGIFMIGKFKLSDMVPEVCECLNIPGLETDASTVLQTFGGGITDELVRFYLVSSGNIITSKIILLLLGKTCTKKSIEFLFSRIWSNSRQLKESAVKCLIDCEFKPSKEDKDRLIKLISDIVGLMTWNISAKICLEKSNNNVLLEVMKKEINRWNKFLFNILSITYDSGSITKIRKNLESETFESVNYALEILNIVIDESIRSKLISLFNAVPDEEKLKKLYQFFPGEIPQQNTLLEDIINRDYNLLSLWTKACTLRNIPEIQGDDMAESVVALLFSPEGILQEESAKLIARSSRELYRSASDRIPESTKKRLDKIVNGETDEKEMLFEKVQFLSNIFAGISEEELLTMAGTIKYLTELPPGYPSFPDDCIIWSLSDEKSESEVYIHYTEKISVQGVKFQNRDNVSYYILPLEAVEEFHNQFPDRSSEISKYIDNNEEYPD